jgi:serine/threonine-protein kinase BUR1
MVSDACSRRCTRGNQFFKATATWIRYTRSSTCVDHLLRNQCLRHNVYHCSRRSKIYSITGLWKASIAGRSSWYGYIFLASLTLDRMGSSGVALLSELLKLDPVKRINAIDALKHEYFRTHPPPLKPGEVPKFNDSHELDGKKNRNRLPPAPAGGSVGVGQNVGPEWASRAGEPWQSIGNRRPDHWANGSGGRQPGARPHERVPLHDGRVPVHRDRGAPDHRPPWAKTAEPVGHPHHRDVGLPPIPPRSLTSGPDRDRRRINRGGGGGGGPDRDTYIPSYGPDDDRRSSRGWDRDRGASRDRDRDRDWHDRGGTERGYGGPTHRSQSRDSEQPTHSIYRR